MAYRGRMLLELVTKLSDQMEQKVEEIHSDDLLVVEVRDHSVFFEDTGFSIHHPGLM